MLIPNTEYFVSLKFSKGNFVIHQSNITKLMLAFIPLKCHASSFKGNNILTNLWDVKFWCLVNTFFISNNTGHGTTLK